MTPFATPKTKVEFTLGRTLLWLGIAVLFTTIQIQQSLNSGKLMFGFMLDDDLAYYRDGLQRLYFLQRDGIIKLLKRLVTIPPHAPGGTLFALLGFAVFGIQDWAPSAGRGLVILGLIVFIAEYLCRGLALIWKLLIVVLALTWRVLGITVVEGRPDMILGLLLACGILLVTESSWLKSSWQKQVIAGAFFGAALVCKPSMSPIGLFLLISTLFVASLMDIWRDKNTQKELLPVNGYCLGTTLAVMAPYYLVHGRSAISYFSDVIFGQGSEVWHMDLSLTGHALYYITGAGGEWLIGDHWLAVWVLLALTNLLIYWQKNRREFGRSIVQNFPLALPLMMVLTWLVLSVPKTKGVYFGAALAGLFLFTGMQMLVYLLQHCQNFRPSKYRFGLGLGALGLLGFAWGQFKWPAVGAEPERWRAAYQVTEKMALDVRHGLPQDAKIFLLSRGYLDMANYHILKRRAGQKYEFPQYNSFILNDLKTNQKLLTQADYIIVETDADHMSRWPAYPQMPTLLTDIQSPQFRLWREYPDYLSDQGGKILIYQRVSK
ncbi:hypothetical protein GlitD10_2791 [Gloeomargarita lithophora Alchichica-D10]|uniref:Glycosyltransferase RgtA/B/C/D-like domain-containing protein n=1 Tax=Gloeomargarita lithophora Alchichica-D10 TaxID=1188229 RepID=A0A1J0AGS2_9CYAN|nr:hypothetical protein [Gloeomargarita lithophora]APB35134.1 hypothetical protein GlitD10_2791 [Gloeomargarita lithophora Alchichica-D10]